MTTLSRDKLKEIKVVCKTMPLESLYLFGSGARGGNVAEKSDLDFLFRFQTNEIGFSISGNDYFDLLLKPEQITVEKADLVAEEKIKNQFFF